MYRKFYLRFLPAGSQILRAEPDREGRGILPGSLFYRFTKSDVTYGNVEIEFDEVIGA